jgi:hypothetical protein
MKFWMVVCTELCGHNMRLLERRGPRWVHDTLLDAEREAERLAVHAPGMEFAVLEVVGLVRTDAAAVPRWCRAPEAL